MWNIQELYWELFYSDWSGQEDLAMNSNFKKWDNILHDHNQKYKYESNLNSITIFVGGWKGKEECE